MAFLTPTARGSRCSQGRQTHARFGKGEHRALDGDDQVAGQGDLEAAAHGHAVHRRDQGLGKIKPGGQPREARRRRSPLAAGRLPFEIVARREGPLAGPGDDAHPLIGIGGEGVQCLAHLEMHGRMHGVHHLGPVEGDQGDRTVAFDIDELVGHGVSGFSCWG